MVQKSGLLNYPIQLLSYIIIIYSVTIVVLNNLFYSYLITLLVIVVTYKFI